MMSTEIRHARAIIQTLAGNRPVCFLPQRDGVSLLAIGGDDYIALPATDPSALNRLDQWLTSGRTWAFGIIGYDLNRSLDTIPPVSGAQDEYPVIAFFRPVVLLALKGEEISVIAGDPALGNRAIEAAAVSADESPSQSVEMKPQISREQYLTDVQSLQSSIARGDIYEVNYCMQLTAEARLIDPFSVWHSIHRRTEAPMSGYFQLESWHLLCGSPERFLKRSGNTIISQPIKGTIRRGQTAAEDEALKKALASNPKERSENVMIVDLVRNDLSRSALPGTVSVEELFGIHTFRTVHHMISTIRAEVPADTRFASLIRDTFPMGSMTGAPKIRAMQLIAQHEHFQRGWYSGALGFIRPEGDFDFNVIIRSVCYNRDLHRLTCAVGSAITFASDPEKEYEECLLKAEALMHGLRSTHPVADAT